MDSYCHEISFLAQQAENVEVLQLEKGKDSYHNGGRIHDNTLLLDFDKELGARLFINSCQKQPKIILKSFCSENSAVNGSTRNVYQSNYSILFI
jgi:hypothetical protein